MNDKGKNVVGFEIDDTLSVEQASNSFDNDYELDLQDFLGGIDDQNLIEVFSYTNKSVQKAGRRLRKKEGDLKSATGTIQQYRAAHEAPLKHIATLMMNCCKELGIDVKPVTRLKRLETIVDKLQRKSLDGKTSNATCVTNMNDIGGCRLIFPDLKSLNKMSYQLKSTILVDGVVRIKDIDDYIVNPKPNDCGYRSLHIIYRYNHTSGKSFNIEAQLRTRLQHLWATTVEIIDILEETKIKTHSHSDTKYKSSLQVKWELLLSIMSQYIADAEGAIELCADTKSQYAQRLALLNEEINALSKLKTFKILSEKIATRSDSKVEHVLLIVDEKRLKLIFSEEFENYREAISSYNRAEKMTRNIENTNTLLISTSNIEQLSDAYPNYLGDCASFIDLLQSAMKSHF